MWGERRREQAGRDRLQELKKRHEQRMRTAQPRPPQGPFWEGLKNEHPEIPAEDLQTLLAIGWDLYFNGAVKFAEAERGTEIEIPASQGEYRRTDNEAPLGGQDLLRFRGRNYLLVRDYVEKKGTGWELEVDGEYWELGQLPGDERVFTELKERAEARDFRKLENYRQLLSLPQAPRQVPRVELPLPQAEWNQLERTQPAKHERLLQEWMADRDAREISTLVSDAWKLRFLLSQWLGVQISDQQFAEQAKKVFDAFEQHPETAGTSWWLDAKMDAAYTAAEEVGKKEARVQVGILLSLAHELQTGETLQDYRDAVKLKSKPIQALIRQYADLPGFRMWVGNEIGTAVQAGRRPERDEWSRMFAVRPASPQRPEPPMPEVIRRGVASPRPPAEPLTPPPSRQPEPAAKRPRPATAGQTATPPPELTQADREYLKEKPPPYVPTVYDQVYDRLRGQVQPALKGDRQAILTRMEEERAKFPDRVRTEYFWLAILNDRPELVDAPETRNLPAVVHGTANIDKALLLGARHIVCEIYAYAGSDKAKTEWDHYLQNSQFEAADQPPRGVTAQALGEFDFGKGKEDVIIEMVEVPAPDYRSEPVTYRQRKLPYSRYGLILQSVFDEAEMEAALFQLAPGGTIITAGKFVTPEWGALASQIGQIDAKSSPDYRAHVEQAKKDFWTRPVVDRRQVDEEDYDYRMRRQREEWRRWYAYEGIDLPSALRADYTFVRKLPKRPNGQ